MEGNGTASAIRQAVPIPLFSPTTMLGTTFKNHSHEERLVASVKDGDRSAAHTLYTEYARYISAICARYIANDEDVRDVVQDTFLRIFSNIGSFHYRGDGSLKAWLARIALNEAVSFLRRNSRITFSDIETDKLNLIDDIPTEEIPTDVIYQSIRELPDGYRAVFNLYVVEGHSHKEIAHLLGIKENSSASQLFKAKAMLAKKLTDYKRINSL